MSLVGLETTLQEVHAILKTAEPIFRNALHGQLYLSTSSIRDFYDDLTSKYGDALNGEGHGSGSTRLRSKIHWAFSAAEEVSQFRSHLSAQLDNVKFLMTTHIWFVMSYQITNTLTDCIKADGDRIKGNNQRQSQSRP